jgi:hypothetical protein
MATIGQWTDVVVAKDGTTSAATDLGGVRDTLLLYVPTIDSATVAIHVSTAAAGTYAALKITNVDGTEEPVLAGASVGGFYWRIPFGFQYFKVVCGAAQNTDAVTFKAWGL